MIRRKKRNKTKKRDEGDPKKGKNAWKDDKQQ